MATLTIHSTGMVEKEWADGYTYTEFPLCLYSEDDFWIDERLIRSTGGFEILFSRPERFSKRDKAFINKHLGRMFRNK